MASAIEKILQLASSNLFDNASVSTCLTAVTDLSNNLDTRVNALIDNAPGALNTLNELAAALGDDANYATTVTNSLSTKANLNGAAFTGDISGVNAKFIDVSGVNFFTTGGNFIGELVGNSTTATSATTAATVTNATQSNITSVGTLSNLVVSGDLSGNDASFNVVDIHTLNLTTSFTKNDVGLGNVDNTPDAGKPVSTAQLTALNLKAPLANPTFTGKVIMSDVSANDASFNIVDIHTLKLTTGLDDSELKEDYIKTNEVDGVTLEFFDNTTLRIKDSGITDVKLSTITTAGKVNGSAITGDISANDASFNIVDIHTLNLTTPLGPGELEEDYIKTNEVDNSTIEFTNDTLNVKNLGITNAKLANLCVDDSKLAGNISDVKLSTITTAGKVNGSAITGDISVNAATATKIASITNSNIVQLTETQTLTNKTLTSPTITGTAHISSELNINSASSGLYFNFDQVRRIGTGNLFIQLGAGRGNTILNLDSGNVGIGTNSPSYPLDVRGYVNTSAHGYYGIYENSSRGGVSANVGSYDYTNRGYVLAYYTDIHVGIRTTNGVWCGSIVTSSDERIKTNIQDVSDNVALQQLRDISCCFYEYKDKVKRGTEKTIGFIAQQVRENMPMAVSIQKGIIPNEMRNIENPQWTTLTDASGNNTYKLTIPDLEDASGNTGETTKYRFYVSNDPSGNEECEKEITSLENEPKSFIFEDQWQNVFLYGKEIDDFHTLDKQKLFALNFSASQEIDRIQQAEKTKLEEQTSKLLAAEAKIVASEAKITSLETTVTNLLTRITALENT